MTADSNFLSKYVLDQLCVTTNSTKLGDKINQMNAA